MTAALRIEIFPADLDAAVAFYADVLGFILERDERTTDHPYVALRRDAVVVGAARRPRIDDVAARRPVIGVELVLEVDDLAAEQRRLEATGWDIDEPLTARPWGLSDIRLLDPDGYYWRITDRG